MQRWQLEAAFKHRFKKQEIIHATVGKSSLKPYATQLGRTNVEHLLRIGSDALSANHIAAWLLGTELIVC